MENALTADAAVDDSAKPTSSADGGMTAGSRGTAGANTAIGAGGIGGSRVSPLDGAGRAAPVAGQAASTAGSGAFEPTTACLMGTVHGIEACDGEDNDCDGRVDEDVDDMPCGSSAQGLCHMGKQSCAAGKWSECQGAIEPSTEVCDASMQDENCNGTGNEGCACTPGEMKPCGAEGACKAGVQTCSAEGAWNGECSIKPQTEVCDGTADEDCDGRTDNGCVCTNGKSEDCANAGQGVCAAGTRVCADGKWSACTSKVVKSAEKCDGLDNDCNGTPDDNACANGQKCSNSRCVECAADADCKSGRCGTTGSCCVPDCGKQCGGTEAKCGTTCTPASCDAGEMCSSNMCVPPTRSCSADGDFTCGVYGATCENRASVNSVRYDLCRWMRGQADCETHGGIWTTANSTFAMNNPGAVPANSSGACLSEVTNLKCDAGEAQKCQNVGATCDAQFNTSKSRMDVCRWASVTIKSDCDKTSGIWTPSTDPFAVMWPQAVTPGRDGACITQVANL